MNLNNKKKIIIIAAVVVVGLLFFSMSYHTLFNTPDGLFGSDKELLHKRLISHPAYVEFREKYPNISEETFSFCYPNKCGSVLYTTVNFPNQVDKLVFEMSHSDISNSIHASIFCTVNDERTKHYNLAPEDIENFTCPDK